MDNLSAEKMIQCLSSLDAKLTFTVSLIVGGGGAMIMAHGYPLATSDIDAITIGIAFEEIAPQVREVAAERGLSPDWLNPHFSTFSHTLATDYKSRLIEVFKGQHLTALALGLGEMLVMKCFAHRPKDIGHAKALIKAGADVEGVMNHLENLRRKKIPGSQAAIDFLEEIEDLLE